MGDQSLDGPAIIVEHDAGVTRITLNRPQTRNAVTTQTLRELAKIVRACDDGVTKTVVLTGTGRAFCSGADLSNGVDDSTVSAAQDVVSTIAEVRPLVIAAINGPASGVGASIALACDLTIASRSAFLSVPFLPLGLVPDGGATHSLVARVGLARAARLAFGGERLPAADAAAWGLIGEVVEDDDLFASVERLVERMLDAPTASVFATKALLRRTDRHELRVAGEAEALAQSALLASAEFARARAGFLAKKPVSFREV